MRLNSTLEFCANDISSKIPLINNTQLETFTIEPNDAIYYIGFDPCLETKPMQKTNRFILGTPLNAGAVRIYTGVASPGPVASTDSFDRILFAATADNIIAVDTSTVATCPNIPPLIGLLTVRDPILSLRTFRSVKQPLPGKQAYCVHYYILYGMLYSENFSMGSTFMDRQSLWFSLRGCAQSCPAIVCMYQHAYFAPIFVIHE